MSLNNRNIYISAVMTALLAMTTHVMAAADYAREQRWHDEITPGIIVGETIYLTQKNQHRFLGIFTEADNTNMGLIVVHGMGIHPDWGMVNTLREQLADHGYATLSIQMPVLAADACPAEYPAIYPEAAERLQIAVSHLKTMGYKHVAIVSHSNGSRMSRVYMSTNPADVDAWASLSLTQGDTFEGVRVPVLDLYGEDDLLHVLASVGKRKTSLNVNSATKQIVIHGANHFFTDHEDAMVKVVKDFLDSVR